MRSPQWRAVVAGLLGSLVIVLALESRPAFSVNAAGDPTPQALGPNRGWIDSIALSPSFGSDGRIWVTPSGGRIFSSQTGGTSWSPSASGETDPIVTGLAVSPVFATDSTVYAAADNGVFFSSDAGQNWYLRASGLAGHSCRQIVTSPTFGADQKVFVSTDAGVFRSANGGLSWQAPGNFGSATLSLAAASANELFAGPSSGGLISSADGGASWQQVAGFPSVPRALAIAVSPAFSGDGTLFVATDSGLWASHDFGSTWTSSAVAGRTTAVAFSPAFSADQTIFAGSASAGGVYLSHDAGKTWIQAQNPPSSFVESLAVSPDYSIDNTVFAGTAGSGIEKSTDGGQTWQLANAGLHGAQIMSLAVDRNLVQVAGDGGASWLALPASYWQDYPASSPFATALDASGSDVFVGTQDHGLQESHDGGTHWQPSSSLTSAIGAIGLAPNYVSSGVLLAASDYVYRSSNRGSDWLQGQGIAGNDVRRFAFSGGFGVDRTVFAATVSHGVYVSRDGGSSWKSASKGLPSAEIDDVLLSRTYDADQTGYAATAGYGIYRTTDGGGSWHPLSDQPSVPVVTALDWLPSGQMLAGTEKGLSVLGGSTWQPLAGSWNDYVTRLAVMPQSGSNSLLIGTLGDGVWQLALPASPATSASATPKPTAPPTPKPTGNPPIPPKQLHPKVSVLPATPVVGQLALVLIRGPGRGHVWVTMTAGKWTHKFSSTLSADGRAGFGFVTPASNITISVKVKGKVLTGYRKIVVRVSR